MEIRFVILYSETTNAFVGSLYKVIKDARYKAQQAKICNNYKNTKLKLLKTNATILA
jgi:hypothetical protein